MEYWYIDLTLAEIFVATILALVIAVFVLIPYSFENEKSKKSMLNFGFFAILIIVIGSTHYKKTKENLIDGFYNSQELLCKENDEKNLILSQAKGFELKSGYFIGDEHIIYVGGCILLQEHHEDAKGNKP
jgi:hypothetical protein